LPIILHGCYPHGGWIMAKKYVVRLTGEQRVMLLDIVKRLKGDVAEGKAGEHPAQGRCERACADRCENRRAVVRLARGRRSAYAHEGRLGYGDGGPSPDALRRRGKGPAGVRQLEHAYARRLPRGVSRRRSPAAGRAPLFSNFRPARARLRTSSPHGGPIVPARRAKATSGSDDIMGA